MQQKWTFEAAKTIFELPFAELVYRAQTVHRENFPSNRMQMSTLLNIKTGRCPEDCAYCPQSGHYDTGLKKEPLMDKAQVIEAAKRAKAEGSTRFCMGAAWRSPRERELETVCEMIEEIKKLGLETCVTLGMLNEGQALRLKEAGLDFYNHNIDTSPEFYPEIITTRTFEDRLRTLEHVRTAGMKVCCGGILGMGETNTDRIKMLVVLANLDEPPESVPINKLIPIPGTPLANQPNVEPFDFIRTIALTRILMPRSYVRLSAGRKNMSDEMQALCFLCGVNSIFHGEKLLTAENPAPDHDQQLLSKLGIEKMHA